MSLYMLTLGGWCKRFLEGVKGELNFHKGGVGSRGLFEFESDALKCHHIVEMFICEKGIVLLNNCTCSLKFCSTLGQTSVKLTNLIPESLPST